MTTHHAVRPCAAVTPVPARALRLLLPLSLAVAAGCFGGGKKGGGDDSTPPSPSVAYRVLDLGTGAISEHPATWSPASAAATSIVFVPVPARAFTLGVSSPASSDQAARVVTLSAFWIARTELTRDQWVAIAGTTPWDDLRPSAVVGTTADGSLPAVGMSADDAVAALASYAARALTLPTDDQWEAAVRGGTDTDFPWMNASPADLIGRIHAWDAGADPDGGPQPTGGRSANAYGVLDGLGNIAEITQLAGGVATVRGGDWTAGGRGLLPAARGRIAADQGHAGVGLRLVLP
jgi:formylglycine-generating enzyme required for sulfatase activity